MHLATASPGRAEENSLHILTPTNEMGEHPIKHGAQSWEGEHKAGGKRQVSALDTSPHLRGFPEWPVTVCPTHIYNGRWTWLIL